MQEGMPALDKKGKRGEGGEVENGNHRTAGWSDKTRMGIEKSVGMSGGVVKKKKIVGQSCVRRKPRGPGGYQVSQVLHCAQSKQKTPSAHHFAGHISCTRLVADSLFRTIKWQCRSD
jgi:hypothetical protein